MSIESPIVSVVDNDETVRESLTVLLRALGFAAYAFSSAKEFLSSNCADDTRCLVLDIEIPGMSAVASAGTKGAGATKPNCLYYGQSDATIRSEMLELAAIECLFKPFNDTELLCALNSAVHAK